MWWRAFVAIGVLGGIWGGVSPSVTHAQRFVVFGGGNEVGHVADVPPEHAAAISASIGAEDPAIGYLYGYFSLFFLDVLTMEGEYVLFDRADEDKIWRLPPDKLESATGLAISDLGKPFLFRFPLGLMLIVVVILSIGARLYLAYRDDLG